MINANMKPNSAQANDRLFAHAVTRNHSSLSQDAVKQKRDSYASRLCALATAVKLIMSGARVSWYVLSVGLQRETWCCSDVATPITQQVCHVTKVLSGDDAVPELFQQRCTATFRKRTDVATRKTLRIERRYAAEENLGKSEEIRTTRAET